MPANIKLITQNSCYSVVTGKIARLIKSERPDICCLQEITGRRIVNKLLQLPEVKYLNLSDPKPEKALKIFGFHNATISRYKILDSREIDLDSVLANGRLRYGGKVLWTDFSVDHRVLRIYNCHLTVSRIGMPERHLLIDHILKNAKKHSGPVVICGDMNTVTPKIGFGRTFVRNFNRVVRSNGHPHDTFPYNEKELFYKTILKHGFSEADEFLRNTWRLPFVKKELFNFKLDWVLYKNINLVGCRLGPYAGDHRSLIAEFKV